MIGLPGHSSRHAGSHPLRARLRLPVCMNERARILVVAATSRELAPADGWLTLKCGVGPVEAAAATAAAIAAHAPALILHVGIAGARRNAALAPGSFVIGTESVYCDVDVSQQLCPFAISDSSALQAVASRVLPSAAHLPIGTSARVGGTTGCDVEAMEGFGVLRAAQRASIPAVEIRSISNDIEEPDRSRWHFAEALAAITGVTPALVAEFERFLSEQDARRA